MENLSVEISGKLICVNLREILICENLREILICENLRENLISENQWKHISGNQWKTYQCLSVENLSVKISVALKFTTFASDSDKKDLFLRFSSLY